MHALAAVNQWMAQAYSDPRGQQGSIATVAQSLSSLLYTAQAAVSMATEMTPTPILAAPPGAQSQAVAMEVVQLTGTPVPAGQREPAPEPKKPRVGEPELIIAE